MQIKGNNIQQARLTIRVSRNTLSFSVVDREAEHQLIYEPYTVKSGVSMAANLRQAFKESTLLQRGYQKVRVYLDSPILLVRRGWASGIPARGWPRAGWCHPRRWSG